MTEDGRKEAKRKEYHDELWDATPDCDGDIVNAPGGGVKCTKCRGWGCY